MVSFSSVRATYGDSVSKQIIFSSNNYLPNFSNSLASGISISLKKQQKSKSSSQKNSTIYTQQLALVSAGLSTVPWDHVSIASIVLSSPKKHLSDSSLFLNLLLHISQQAYHLNSHLTLDVEAINNLIFFPANLIHLHKISNINLVMASVLHIFLPS